MIRCSRCDRGATWRARVRVGSAATYRLVCETHARDVSDSEVLRLLSLVRVIPGSTEAVALDPSDETIATLRRRPLQSRLGRVSA